MRRDVSITGFPRCHYHSSAGIGLCRCAQCADKSRPVSFIAYFIQTVNKQENSASKKRAINVRGEYIGVLANGLSLT